MRTLFVVAGCLALALMVTGLYAAEGKAPATKSGTVAKVDVEGKKLTVTVKNDMVFTITADTKFVQGDAAKTLADVKVGAKVSVEYIRGDGDLRTAVKVTIN